MRHSYKPSLLTLLCLLLTAVGCAPQLRRVPFQLGENVSKAGLDVVAAKNGIFLGAAVSQKSLEQDPRYKELAASEFAIITPENELKFDSVHPERIVYNFSPGDALLTFAEENSLLFRGHNLVWYRQLPTWLIAKTWTKPELESVLCDHITQVVSHYRGRVYAWDVVNEAIGSDGGLRKNLWLDVIGPEYVDQAFRCARAADPNALLIYNEFGTEVSGAKADAQFALIKGLLQRGVPIDGVGFQIHLLPEVKKLPLLFERKVRRQLARYSDLGLAVHITEMDVVLRKPVTGSALKRQAEIYSDVLQACLATARCSVFSVWGVSDQYSWVPQILPDFGAPLLFDEHSQPKPAYDKLRRTMEYYQSLN